MAVNTYRFITMYILIGLVMGGIATFNSDLENENRFGYNLSTQYKIQEISDRGVDIGKDSDNIVKTNQQVLTGGWGNENAFGRNIFQFLSNFLFPANEISNLSSNQLSETEHGALWLLIMLRAIITAFASYEVFQILIKSKTT